MYKQQENDIITRLQPLTVDAGPFKGYDIVPAPETETEFKQPFTKARVTVMLIGSKFGPIRATDLVSQDEVLTWLFIIESKTLRQVSGIYEVATNLKRKLLGFRPSWCERMIAGELTIQERDAQSALYTYNLTFTCKTLAVEEVDAVDEPLLECVAFEEGGQQTVVVTNYLQEETSTNVLTTESGNNPLQ